MESKLRVLILSQFFYPEMGAPAARFLDFSRYFLKNGHEVMVLTGFPNFPSGKIHEGYGKKIFMEEDFEGIKIFRTWLHSSPRLGFANKAMGYASFTASSILGAASRLPDFDVMVATAPPPTIGLSALAIAKGRNRPFVYDLRDLWPEAIVNSGRLKNTMLIGGFERLNQAAYQGASAITTVSNGKKEALVQAGVPQEKIEVIPNGVSLEAFDENAEQNMGLAEKMLRENGVPRGAFTITYAGIMNPPQGLDGVIRVASSMNTSHPNLHFIFVGNGSCRSALIEQARNLDNVTFLPEQPREYIPSFLSLSDANVVPLKPRKDSHTVPSKIFEYMAAGRPLLLSADGEPRNIVKDSLGGLISPAGDETGLKSNLIRLLQDSVLRCEAGANGRHFVEANYNRRELNRRFLKLLEEAKNGGKR